MAAPMAAVWTKMKLKNEAMVFMKCEFGRPPDLITRSNRALDKAKSMDMPPSEKPSKPGMISIAACAQTADPFSINVQYG